jgi:hypothetical protein
MATDDPFADIGAKSADAFSDIGAPSATADVLKQIPSGLAAGLAEVPAFPARAANFLSATVGPAITSGIEYFAPGKAAEMRELERQRLERVAAFAQQRPGAEHYLPEPQTPAGRVVRTGFEFVPSFVLGGARALAPGQTITQYAAREAVPAARLAGAGATAGVTSELAGQATEGTKAEPVARVVGGLAGGTAALRASEAAAARAATPTIAALDARGGALYDQFRASGLQMTPQASPTYAFVTRGELQQRGLTDVTADATHRVLQRLERQPATSPQDLHGAYQELGAVARGAKDANERLAAQLAQERLLQFMENPPAWTVAGGNPAEAVGLLREANANWAAARRAENLSQRVTKAELKAGSTYSGLNLENELRRRVGVLAEPNVRGGFTPAEQAAFERFAEGNIGSNTRRYLKNLLGGGGGLGALGAGTVGAGAGQYFGIDPLTYGGGALVAGLGLAKYGNLRSLAQARELEAMLRARSPLAAQTAMPRPPGALPLVALPPSLGGDEQSRARLNTLGSLGD